MLTLKEKQFRILQKYKKNYSKQYYNLSRIEDCLTAEEAFKDRKFFKNNYRFDWNYEDAKKALKCGQIIIYNVSPNFAQGNLVSPSRSLMESRDFIAYAQTVPLNTLIWTDPYRAYIADITKESDFDIEFSFLAQHKVTIWKDCIYKIEATNYEEAKSKLIERLKKDTTYFYEGANQDYYYDYDTQEFINPKENNGEATFKILESINNSNNSFFDNKELPELTAKKI